VLVLIGPEVKEGDESLNNAFICKNREVMNGLTSVVRGLKSGGIPGGTTSKVPRSSFSSSSSRTVQSSLKRIFQEFWIQIAIGIIAIATLTIFFQDIYITGSDAIASDYYNFVLVIPFLSAYLIYRDRKTLTAIMPLKDDDERKYLNLTVGISLLAIALIVYLYGSGTFYPLDYHIIALEIFLCASILLLFNRKTLRTLIIPILLFMTALPSATQFELSFWLAMSWMSVVPAQWLLHAVGLNVTITLPSANIPTLTLKTATGKIYDFGVGVASSGTYSVVGFTLFAGFLGYISKGRLWKKIFLFVLAYPLLVVVNIFREFVLVYVANLYGTFAFNVFHATSGIVLVFIVTFLLLVLGERLLKLDFFPSRSSTRFCSWCEEEKRQAHNFCINCGRFLRSAYRRVSSRDAYALAAIFIAVLAFVSFLSPAVQVANAPTNIPIQSISSQNADTLLPQVKGWTLSFIDRDYYLQEALRQDASLVYEYTSQGNTSSTPTVLQVMIQVSAEIHTPETSLLVYPVLFGHPGATAITDSDIQILNQPPVIGKFFVYQQEGSSSIGAFLYWTTRAVFNFGSYSDFRNVMISIWADTNTLVASGAIPSPANLTAIKQLYLPLARSIALFWQPVSSNSVVQSLFHRWTAPMIGAALLPLLVVGSFTSIEKRREARANSKLVGKLLTAQAKSLLESLRLACTEDSKNWLSRFKLAQISIKKNKAATLEQVLNVHRQRTGKELSPLDAVAELMYAEHMGLVKRDIVSNISREPIQVWKLTIRKF
jgi:exosortase/archaeosortase family protein